MHQHLEKILFSEQQIQKKVCELGAYISADYQKKNLVVIGVLKGAVFFWPI